MRILDANLSSSGGDAGRAMESSERPPPSSSARLRCPRCDSTNTKFCYYNNYSLAQPRHFCKACKRYWTRGGTLRNVPVGGGCRKNNKRGHRIKQPPGEAAAAATKLLQVINDPSVVLPPPPPRSTSFPALPPSTTIVDDDGGASPSSMLYSLPALPSAFESGPASCTSTAFVDLRHHAAISSGTGDDDPALHQLPDEYRGLSAGGEVLEHLPQQLVNDDITSLLLQPQKSEQEGGGAAARLLFDQQMMIMMNSTDTEWQIPMDHSIVSPSSQINYNSSSSSSYAYLKEASSSLIGWPDAAAAAAANYRWSTTMTAANRI